MANRIKHFTGTAGGTFHSGVPVRKFKGGRMIGGASALLELLPQLLAEAVQEQADDVLELAKENIRANTKKEGVALGAGASEEDLAVSGYISTGSAQSFEQAKDRMIENNSRDARRGLFAPSVEFAQPAKGYRAVVSFAAGRAKLMHDGYGQMSGVPFLDDAFDGVFPLMEARLMAVGRALQRVNVPHFMDVDESNAREIDAQMERSFRYLRLGPGMNLLGHGRKRDRQMRRAADKKAAGPSEAARELRALRGAIAKVNRDRR
jgi:hypothetical protein